MTRRKILQRQREYIVATVIVPLLIAPLSILILTVFFAVLFTGHIDTKAQILIFLGYELPMGIFFTTMNFRFLIDIISCSTDIFEGEVHSSGSYWDYVAYEKTNIQGIKLVECVDNGVNPRKFDIILLGGKMERLSEEERKWMLSLAFNTPPPEGPVKFIYLKHSKMVVELLHVTPGKLDDEHPLMTMLDVMSELYDEEEEGDAGEASEE